MRKNDLVEIKKMDIKQIEEKVKKTKSEIAALVIDKNMGKLANLKTIQSKRKDIAQMLTIIKQKQLLKELEDVKNAK